MLVVGCSSRADARSNVCDSNFSYGSKELVIIMALDKEGIEVTHSNQENA
jgi:hypothetical protein